MKLVLTCEHAGRFIPKSYQTEFVDFQEQLNSHRGMDLGAFNLFNSLIPLANFSKYNPISRLLIEVNRSVNHRQLFSEKSIKFSEAEKKKLIAEIYNPYRNEIQEKIEGFIKNGEKVLHLSVHSFTPIFNGVERNSDIGLLYDPSRKSEQIFARHFKNLLNAEDSELKVRFNYPYLGKSDGFTTFLRNKFLSSYMGIELEVNQKFSEGNNMKSTVKFAIFQALETLLN